MKKRLVFVTILLLFCLVVFANEKPDALKHYRAGRNLDTVGRFEEASVQYNRAVDICLDELKENPNNMESYAVYTWSLYRLKKYSQTVNVCLTALRIKQDPRIIQTLGEAYFYLNNFDGSLQQMQRYISLTPNGDRVSVAYFFQGEIYRIRKNFSKADIAYTAAVYFEPKLPLWWFRLGSVREALGDKQNAIFAYKKALEIAPEYSDVKNALNRLQ